MRALLDVCMCISDSYFLEELCTFCLLKISERSAGGKHDSVNAQKQTKTTKNSQPQKNPKSKPFHPPTPPRLESSQLLFFTFHDEKQLVITLGERSQYDHRII